MKTEPTLILTKDDIKIKTKRISLQILETCLEDKTIVIAGIEENGAVFAKLITDEIKKDDVIEVLKGFN